MMIYWVQNKIRLINKNRMKQLKTLLLLLICGTMALSATNKTTANNKTNKIVLSSLDIKNSSIQEIALNVDESIGAKKIEWPMTKILFYEEKGKIVVDIVAIDNTWFKLIDTDDKPYGYFIVNNRLFLVSTKNDLINLEPYFSKNSENQRTFGIASKTKYSRNANPRWKYQFIPNNVFLLGSMNLGQLAN